MTGFHVYAGASNSVALPDIRKISFSDVFGALGKGLEDFREKPSHYVFLCLIYPVFGFVLTRWASTGETLHLVYPLIAGFALIGPFAAVGLYEISRRRERGLDTSWRHALDVRKSPAIPSIVAVGAMLTVFFLLWLYAAQALFVGIFGSGVSGSFFEFVHAVFTTSRGWQLLVYGNLIGVIFAFLVLFTTSIAFPLLLDQDCGAAVAVMTSVRVFMANPSPILLWGIMVIVLLMIGSLLFFVGLAVVVPVLGHATWHLYRKTVVTPDDR